MKKNIKINIIFLIAICFSCKYQKLLKSTNYEEKYAKGIEYYKKGNCSKAYPLLEDCIPYFRGRDEMKEIIFMLGECDMSDGNYETAKERFKYLSNLFRGTETEEKALFYYVINSYLLSSDYDLDNKGAIETISSANVFLARFPQSQFVDSVRTIKRKMETNLFTKELDIAFLYFTIEDYKAARYAFEYLFERYPGIECSKCYWAFLKSAYLLAKNSSIQKRRERYNDFIQLYKTYYNKVSDPNQIDELKKYFNLAKKEAGYDWSE